ncbi:hypothetical protein ZWY2020_051411 [Hordeum vulgare]|nr:hypothetical protein ZWY2020_051411 [Hordeum vulgare]
MEAPIEADGKSSEQLPGNGSLPKIAEKSQDLGGNPGMELPPLHQGKEVILVEDNDSGQEDGGSAKVDENAPRIGLRFKTYDDALKYYKQYAVDSGFSAITLKSSYLKSGVCRRLVLGCSRSGRGRANACYLSRETAKINCPARISLKLRQDRWLHIDDTKLDHNHPLNQSSDSPMSCYKKLTDAKSVENASRLKGRRNVPIADKEQGKFTEIGRLKTPLTVTKFYMEEQLAKAYTINMFRKFQEELKATMYCDGMPSKVDGQFVTFEVKECSYMEDGKETESRIYEVYFCKEGLIVECECGFFQFTGILCRHALSVFKLHDMFEIPSRYVLDRWKRDYKKLHALAHYPNEMLLGDTVERHDYLSTQCRQVLNLGFISESRYLVALKLLREAERTLLYDGQPARDRQPRLLSFEADAPENGQGLFSSQFPEGAKNSLSTNAKSPCLPAKKVVETNPDAVLRSNKEQDFLRSSFVPTETNMIQGTPSASHLESPDMGVQGSIHLMEGISPNLTFGPHFGMDVSHQHELPNQPRMMPNNFMQVQADPHVFGNQWAYNPTMQDNPMLRTPTRRAE